MSITQKAKDNFFAQLTGYLKYHLGFEWVSVADDPSSLAHIVTGVTKEGLAVHYHLTAYSLAHDDDLHKMIEYIGDAMKAALQKKTAQAQPQESWNPYNVQGGLGGALQPPPDQLLTTAQEYHMAQVKMLEQKAAALKAKLAQEMYQGGAQPFDLLAEKITGLKEKLGAALYQDVVPEQGAQAQGSWEGFKGYTSFSTGTPMMSTTTSGLYDAWISGKTIPGAGAPPLGGSAPPSGPAPKNMYELYGVSQNETEREPEP